MRDELRRGKKAKNKQPGTLPYSNTGQDWARNLSAKTSIQTLHRRDKLTRPVTAAKRLQGVIQQNAL
jgi:hypothetical protein